MAHFAELNYDNQVLRVVTVDNVHAMTPQGIEREEIGIAHLIRSLGGGIWKQCSFTASRRGTFPAPGFTYDPLRDQFLPPRPFSSWQWDETACVWRPPVPCPEDGIRYYWDEAAQLWVET